MNIAVGTVTLNESNGILYSRWNGCYAAINNPENCQRGETYRVLDAKKKGRNYYLTLGEKIVRAEESDITEEIERRKAIIAKREAQSVQPHSFYCLCDECDADYYAMTGER